MKFGKHIVANPGAEFAEVQICDETWDSLGGTTILPDYLSAQELRELASAATEAADLLEQTKGAKS